MPRHFNPSIAEDCNRLFNFKSADNLSSELMPNIQPVILVERKTNIVIDLSSTGSGNATIFTTPTDKDFYLNGCIVNFEADVANDSTFVGILAFIDGVQRVLLGINKISLTAQRQTVTRVFQYPVKIDRGTTILSNTGFTVGVQTRRLGIDGYTVETTKGG